MNVVWHKQEMFKGRNILYGTGWAGWGFESNVTAAAANAAPLNVLRANPIFEHDPGGMFTNSIPQTLQNSILAKGIPALSEPVGREIIETFEESVDMNEKQDHGWCRNDSVHAKKWLHSDIQNAAYFYTHKLFALICSQGGLE